MRPSRLTVSLFASEIFRPSIVSLATTASHRFESTFAPPTCERHNFFKMGDTSSTSQPKEEQKLPPLTPAEFRAYNIQAEGMDYYHRALRQKWDLLWKACLANKRPMGMSLRQFLSVGVSFCSHLSVHHQIEETHMYPLWATRMPEARESEELLAQHKEIHKGMDVLEDYLKECLEGECELSLKVLKGKMEFWKDVLWKHLDQEVEMLGAENMRKYWTIEEIRRMPM